MSIVILILTEFSRNIALYPFTQFILNTMIRNGELQQCIGDGYDGFGLYECDESMDHQKWHIDAIRDGYFVLRNGESEKCIDGDPFVGSINTTECTHILSGNYIPSQFWKVKDMDAASNFLLLNKDTNACMSYSVDSMLTSHCIESYNIWWGFELTHFDVRYSEHILNGEPQSLAIDFVHRESDECLSGNDLGTGVIMSDCVSTDTKQQWYIHAFLRERNKGYYVFKNAESQKCLSADLQVGWWLLKQRDCDSYSQLGSNLLWYFSDVADYFTLESYVGGCVYITPYLIGIKLDDCWQTNKLPRWSFGTVNVYESSSVPSDIPVIGGTKVIDCVSIESAEIAGFTSVRCSGTHKLTSCGYRGGDGSLITSQTECAAISTTDSPGKAVAIARCCDISQYLSCNSYSLTGEGIKTQKCGRNEHVVGCSIKGGFDDIKAVYPQTSYNSIGPITKQMCTAEQKYNEKGIIGANCCSVDDETDYSIECEQVVGAPSPTDDDVSIAHCSDLDGNKWFLSSCNAYDDKGFILEMYVDTSLETDVCRVKGTSLTKQVHAIAICCRIRSLNAND